MTWNRILKLNFNFSLLPPCSAEPRPHHEEVQGWTLWPIPVVFLFFLLGFFLLKRKDKKRQKNPEIKNNSRNMGSW